MLKSLKFDTDNDVPRCRLGFNTKILALRVFFLASDCTVLYNYFLLYQTYQRYEYIIKKKVIDILLHTSSQNAKY
jgi:hypothetical protein